MRYVKDLVKSGADVNKIDKSGQTGSVLCFIK